MDIRDQKALQKSRNILIQSNDPAFNYAFLKGNDLEDFHALPEIVGMGQYDYSFKRDDGDENNLPTLTPASLLMCSQNLEDTEEWYRQKHPNLPEEYYGIMARYSTGQLLTKKEAKNAIKKARKKNKDPPVGLQMRTGNFSVEFD